MPTPRAILIAGPNGAGKTTFARSYLPHEGACEAFLNADLIAAGLSPFRPEAAALQAGKALLKRLDELVAARASFALETTLSGKLYLRRMAAWRAAGYRVELNYLWVASAEESVRRVAARVAQGGHHVPPEDVRRRYGTSLRLFFEDYAPAVDEWSLYDSRERPARKIAECTEGRLVVGDEQLFAKISRGAQDRIMEAQESYLATADRRSRGVYRALIRANIQVAEESRRTGVPLVSAHLDGTVYEEVPSEEEVRRLHEIYASIPWEEGGVVD